MLNSYAASTALVVVLVLFPAILAPGQQSEQATRDPASFLQERLLLRAGGTARSEAAVAAGLRWLAEHQAPDGHWCLAEFANHGKCNCTGPGRQQKIAATALALLPFLSAGHTQQLTAKQSPYARTVERGLKYLLGKLSLDGEFDSVMVDQGLATQALCLAYLQTRDPQLKGPAQRAVAFICAAQNDGKGGWRYRPKMPADTEQSVWQMQALRVAQLAGIEVPRQTWDGMHRWLDHVAGDAEGARYGYTQSQQCSPRMSAAGLLCRQFLGWKPHYRGLKKGTDVLLNDLPLRRDVLLHYWTTQVMHHQGGAAWADWNPRMRDLLIETQDQLDQHSKGSWPPHGDPFGGQLGRLGVTALSVLILEIYYSVDPPGGEQNVRAPNARELLALWDDLGWTAPLTAHQAIWALSEAPAQAVPFVAARVQPVATVARQRLTQLIADLDDRQFETRRRASDELQKLGELAEAALREELAKAPPLEVHRRIEKLLAEVECQVQTPEQLQSRRAVAALKAIATPEARQVLEKLAKGNPEARLTREAKAALE